MKPRIAKLWTDALRSGKYKQTRGRLRDHTGMCCLGVLCDLASKEGVGAWSFSGDRYEAGEGPYEVSAAVLPPAVRAWAGMKTDNGAVRMKTTPKFVRRINPDPADTNGDTALVSMNDDGRYSFKQIANIIDRYAEQL